MLVVSPRLREGGSRRDTHEDPSLQIFGSRVIQAQPYRPAHQPRDYQGPPQIRNRIEPAQDVAAELLLQPVAPPGIEGIDGVLRNGGPHHHDVQLLIFAMRVDDEHQQVEIIQGSNGNLLHKVLLQTI